MNCSSRSSFSVAYDARYINSYDLLAEHAAFWGTDLIEFEVLGEHSMVITYRTANPDRWEEREEIRKRIILEEVQGLERLIQGGV